MTPERIAGLVGRWARLYTRNLPESSARRRIEEIDRDLGDQIAHERDSGIGERRISLHIASRMIRGVAADALWRRRMIAAARKEAPIGRPAYRSAIRVALVTTVVLLVPLVAMQFTAEVDWGVFDFVFAALLLGGSGVLLELAVRNRSRARYRAAAVLVGVVAIALGEADDAPGLVLFGLLLIVGTVGLTLRTAHRSA